MPIWSFPSTWRRKKGHFFYILKRIKWNSVRNFILKRWHSNVKEYGLISLPLFWPHLQFSQMSIWYSISTREHDSPCMCSHFHLIFLEYRVALNTPIFAELFMISNAYLLHILRWGRYSKYSTNIMARIILRKNRLKFLAILYSFCSWTKMTNVFFLTKFGLQRIVFF